MSHYSDTLPPKPLLSFPQSLFHPDLLRIDSPQLLSHLSETMGQEYPSLAYKNQSINL
jgi:hypothetical protein